jgi:virulence-associated protein VapD
MSTTKDIVIAVDGDVEVTDEKRHMLARYASGDIHSFIQVDGFQQMQTFISIYTHLWTDKT